MSQSIAGTLADEAALVAFAQDLATAAERPLAIALQGPLGAGKTSFARALLHALGHRGPVRSPTYTLVEQYPLHSGQAWHLDLYRLGSPEEVDWLGLHDFDPHADWLLVEWPQRADQYLPKLDLNLSLDYAEPGRDFCLRALSQSGARTVQALATCSSLPSGPG